MIATRREEDLMVYDITLKRGWTADQGCFVFVMDGQQIEGWQVLDR